MELLRDAIFGNTKLHYMENGFSQSQADAMSWIASQKAKGKFFGATSGLFLAFTWGHWHDRIIQYFRFNFNRKVTQLGIIMGSILFCDYLFTGRRTGANQYFANKLLFNTNLFYANVDSLIQNFDIFEGKFNQQQVETFNYKKKLVRVNHNKLANKKWNYNPAIHTQEQFMKKILSVYQKPWIQGQGPSNLGSIIDQTGQKLGVVNSFKFGWSQIH